MSRPRLSGRCEEPPGRTSCWPDRPAARELRQASPDELGELVLDDLDSCLAKAGYGTQPITDVQALLIVDGEQRVI